MPLHAGREFLSIPGPTVIPDAVLAAMQRPAVDIYSGPLLELTDSLLADVSKIFATKGKSYIYIGNGHAAWEATAHDVAITVDGKRQQVTTHGDTVAAALDAAGVEVGSHDLLVPSADTRLTDSTAVVLRRGRQLALTVDGKTRDVYRKGEGPAVLVFAEMPGITPKVLDFADRVVALGCTAVVPHLFGVPGAVMTLATTIRAIAPACVSKEFSAWATGKTSPVVEWSKALARRMSEAGAPTEPVLLEGVSHEMIIMMFARPFARDTRALDAVLPFLAKVTAPSVAVQAQGG